MRPGLSLAWLAAALLPVACLGGAAGSSQCEVRVVEVDRWEQTADGPDVAYRVRGSAGSPGVVWLVAKRPAGDYVAGFGVDVGPGPFEAIVDLKLTANPERFEVVLEVAGRRCRAVALAP